MENKLTLEHLAPYENMSLKSLPKEIWKEHPLYTSVLISSIGRVKSKDRYVNHNHGGKALKRGRVLSQRITEKGYLDCGITHEGKTKTIRAHRLVAEAFIPNPENKPQVNHKDGNKLNNCVDNLEWNTSTENVRHAWKTGLNKEKTDQLVKEIVGFIKHYLDLRIKVSTPIGTGEVQIDNTCFRIIYEDGRIENLIKSIRTWRNDFKIILRSLSDLTKEIEHNGEKFVPIDYINGEFRLEIPNKIELQNWVKNISIHFVLAEWVGIEDLYKLFKLLFQWHFDVFGLIDRGLAIDINTIGKEENNG